MAPSLAVRVNGGKLRFAQFTRHTRTATIVARVHKSTATKTANLRRIDFEVRDAPGQLHTLESTLARDAVSIATHRRDDKRGIWDATLVTQTTPLVSDLLDRLEAIFPTYHELPITFSSGFLEVQAEVEADLVSSTLKRARTILGPEELQEITQ